LLFGIPNFLKKFSGWMMLCREDSEREGREEERQKKNSSV
jgi:hypothetical protein